MLALFLLFFGIFLVPLGFLIGIILRPLGLDGWMEIARVWLSVDFPAMVSGWLAQIGAWFGSLF